MSADDEEFAARMLARAAAAAPPMTVDVERQLHLGGRRRRTRRWAGALAGVAGVAAVGVALPAVLGVPVPWPAPPGVTAPGGTGWPTTGWPSATADPPAPLSDDELLASFDASPAADTDRIREFQEAVAQCMDQAGFEYLPVVPEQVITDPGPDPVPDEDWYTANGYGISIDTSPADAPAGEPDPNAGYVASLSPADREAYRQALEGTEGAGRDPEDLGCLLTSADAMAAAHPGPALPPLVAQLQEQVFTEYYGRLETDPRMARAEAALAGCAAKAGATDYDPYPAGMSVGLGEHTFTPFMGWDAYDQVWQAWQDLTAAGEPGAADLAAFQQWERGMAVAAYRCNAPVGAVGATIRAEVVREIVRPHRAELEQLAASWPDD